MFSSFLLVLGVGVLTLALRSFRHPVLQKLGVFGLLATSFLAGYYLAGSAAAGVACAASWLLLPWLEILTRIRRLRMPMERILRHRAPPPEDSFPALPELTNEIEMEGFAHVDDAGWDWEDHQQFFRLFHREKDHTLAAICLIEQFETAFYYLSLSSRGKDGRIWTTWNYPFANSLMSVPQLKVNRLRSDRAFPDLAASHGAFLQKNSVTVTDLAPVDPETMQEEIQKDLRAQVAFNLNKGLLARTDDGGVRYSWRGWFYLWLQFMRDIIRPY
jgi:hypothetical protein